MSVLRTLACSALCVFSAAALADTPPPSGVLNLQASASVEVPKDLIAITFSTTRNGNDAGAVQSALKQALDAALAEARRVAKPGQVDVQTGDFSLYPRYGDKGAPAGWQGSAQLVVQGRDMATIAQLGGRITTLTIARVAYGLSREAREKAEADVTSEAIARFRAKATDMARAFGYAGATIRDVAVNGSEPSAPVPMMRMKAMASSAADESLPVEAGRATVAVTVNGSVQMTLTR